MAPVAAPASSPSPVVGTAAMPVTRDPTIVPNPPATPAPIPAPAAPPLPTAVSPVQFHT